MITSQRAYSLYGLLMMLSVFALMMALGLPSLGNMVASHRLRVEIDGLFHAIHLARKESVVRRRADENQRERADEFGQSRFLIRPFLPFISASYLDSPLTT